MNLENNFNNNPFENSNEFKTQIMEKRNFLKESINLNIKNCNEYLNGNMNINNNSNNNINNNNSYISNSGSDVNNNNELNNMSNNINNNNGSDFIINSNNNGINDNINDNNNNSNNNFSNCSNNININNNDDNNNNSIPNENNNIKISNYNKTNKENNIKNKININIDNGVELHHSKDDFSNNPNHNLKLKKDEYPKKNYLLKSMMDCEMLLKNKEKFQKRKEKEEQSKAQVKDIFKCYICYNKVTNPRMCLHCKKLTCEKCIKNWLKTKEMCGFCRSKIKFEDTISVPLNNELISFFIEQVEDDKNNDFNSIICECEEDENIFSNRNKDLCYEHNNMYEYFCVQCNKKYCSKCLVILNDSSKIHENHLILHLKDMKNKDFNEPLEQFKKLDESKKNIEDLISLCNLKIREMEIEKSQMTKYLNKIIDVIDVDLYDKLKYYKTEHRNLKKKEEEYNRAIETTPLALQNIIKSHDHGQGEKIYDHIIKLKDIPNNSELKLKKFFVESFSSEQFEFIIPNNGNYTENLVIFNKTVNNFIPDNEVKIVLRYSNTNICFFIEIRNIKNEVKEEKINYYGFVLINNKKYGCEFVNFEDLVNYDKHILSVEINAKQFISFKDENNKIRYRLIITRQENK